MLLPLKSGPHIPKKFESLQKLMKNAFCFILKALSVLEIFKFLSRHFVHVGKTA